MVQLTGRPMRSDDAAGEPWPMLLSGEPARIDPSVALLQQRASGTLEKLMQSTPAQSRCNPASTISPSRMFNFDCYNQRHAPNSARRRTRRAPRRPARELDGRYSTRLDPCDGREPITCALLDYSVTGMRLELPEDMALPDEVQVLIGEIVAQRAHGLAQGQRRSASISSTSITAFSDRPRRGCRGPPSVPVQQRLVLRRIVEIEDQAAAASRFLSLRRRLRIGLLRQRRVPFVRRVGEIASGCASQ